MYALPLVGRSLGGYMWTQFFREGYSSKRRCGTPRPSLAYIINISVSRSTVNTNNDGKLFKHQTTTQTEEF
jgi:hypothetical protein